MPAPFEKKDIPIEAKKKSPGPAAYNLPTSFGSKAVDPTKQWRPSYSFGVRGKDTTFTNQAPHYVGVNHVLTRTGKISAPQYSMGGRFKSAKNKMVDYPSPNSYNPTKPEVKRTVTIKAPYKYSHDNRIPGPQQYKTPAGIGERDPTNRNCNQTSFAGKNDRFGVGSHLYDSSRTAGPAAYTSDNTNSFKRKAPTFTLSSRTNTYRDKTMKPGPGAHNVETAYPRSGPKFSIGVKHSDYMMPFLTDVDI